MEKNGKKSCTKRSRHLNIRYFYVKDLIARGEAEVDYCPTEDMLADFFSKPLQGNLFKKFRSVILGHSPLSVLYMHKSVRELKERVSVNNTRED